MLLQELMVVVGSLSHDVLAFVYRLRSRAARTLIVMIYSVAEEV